MHWHADGISGNTYHPTITNKKGERWESKSTLQTRMAVEAASLSYSAEGISPAKPCMRTLQSMANLEDHWPADWLKSKKFCPHYVKLHQNKLQNVPVLKFIQLIELVKTKFTWWLINHYLLNRWWTMSQSECKWARKVTYPTGTWVILLVPF